MKVAALKKFFGGFHFRLFFFTVAMIILAQGVYVFIIRLNSGGDAVLRLKLHKYLTVNVKKPLTGRLLQEAEHIMDFYNGYGPQLWFESPDGAVLAGSPVPGLRPTARAKLGQPLEFPDGTRIWRGRADWETGKNSPLELMVMPVELASGRALICYTHWSGSFPYHSRHFSLGLTALIVLGGALTWLLAKNLANPLARLREEVLALDGESLGRGVTVQGPREVADVAKSVNELSKSLERRDRCLRELMVEVSHDLRSPLTRLDFAFTFIAQGLDWAKKQLAAAEAKGFAPLDPPLDFGPGDERSPIRASAGPARSLTGTGGRQGPKPDPLELGLKYLAVYRCEIAKMDELIGATLLANRLELGYALKTPSLLNFTELCRATAELFKPIFSVREMEFTISLESNIDIFGEKILIERLLNNILDNAAKYTRPRGKIRLSVAKNQDEAIDLELVNSCEPLGERRLNKLFDPFYQASGSSQGCGLGLSLARQIVGVHGGRIAAHSDDKSFRLSIVWPPSNRPLSVATG
ncbi:MAG: HAMP domain-containing histidine kinase [Deltaproteobacteria bacterium]|jgi:signal transduction histidine kinase|nr:HAMP domain-containing histidine kinase [Deltaproteobacteria bacterium]